MKTRRILLKNICNVLIMSKPPFFRTEIARVYMLSDFEGNVFYIGCTIQPLSVRLKMHLQEAKTNRVFTNKDKNKKIKELDFKVLVTELEKVEVSGYKGYQMNGRARDVEMKWLIHYHNTGSLLTNKRELRFLIKRNKLSPATQS